MKPKAHDARQRLRGFFILDGVVLLVLIDQFLKYLARTNPAADIDIIGDTVQWIYYANPGIAFSIPFPNWALVIFTPLFLVGLWAFWGRKKRSLFFTSAILLVTGGALSNLADRILFEVTIDYLQIFTSVINMADVMIVVGALMLLFHKNPSHDFGKRS